MGSSPIRCTRFWCACTSIIITFVLFSLSAIASGGTVNPADTVHKGMSILFIGIVNADCYPDTIWGVRNGSVDESTYQPRVIVWGRIDRSGIRGSKDSTVKCRGHIPDRFKVPYTLITYPTWQNLHSSFSAVQFNPEDTLYDLFISIRVRVGEGANQRDTMRRLVVFGQSGLDTIARIDLAEVGLVQARPFVAMELRKGSEVVDEKRRDFTGRNSYEVHRVGFKEKEEGHDTTSPHPSVAAGVVRVYPNPTGISAQVEGASIPPGDYNVEIVAVNGEVTQSQEVAVKESGSLLRTLDVQHLPSGYYMIRIQQYGKLIGTYPIVVNH